MFAWCCRLMVFHDWQRVMDRHNPPTLTPTLLVSLHVKAHPPTLVLSFRAATATQKCAFFHVCIMTGGICACEQRVCLNNNRFHCLSLLDLCFNYWLFIFAIIIVIVAKKTAGNLPFHLATLCSNEPQAFNKNSLYNKWCLVFFSLFFLSILAFVHQCKPCFAAFD